MKNKKALIMAGGTGGHVFPGLALAEELKKRDFDVEWLGTEKGLEAKLVPAAKIPLHFIPVKGVRGKGLASLLLAPFNIVSSVISAGAVIKAVAPDVVVGLGGFVAGPGGIAAKFKGLPLLIHEQNAVAGTTNKILAKFANKILLAFPGSLANGECIGNPVREEIETIDAPEIRFSNESVIDGRNKKLPVRLLVVGGSRGALAINEIVPKAVALLVNREGIEASDIDIWHQTGAQKDQPTEALYRELAVEGRIAPFIDDMAQALAWADIVICRSGALTVSELAAVGLGSILIPFPYAIDDHQTANANYLADAGAAIVRQQKELSVEGLADLLNDVLFDRKKMQHMACLAKGLAKPRAAVKFADYCEEFVHV